MDLQSDTLALAAVAWLVASALITIVTWRLASTRVEAPGWVTAINGSLCLFPPLSLVVLAYIATLNNRSPR
jgi:UPF0716 family protein affecting phage T7 exclusion